MNAGVYLDHNASTPLRPQAADAMGDAMRRCGNPSSVHRHGRMARRLVEDARDRIAALVDAGLAGPAQVVFTSGGTEANALALRGSGRRRVFASAVEHVSVLRGVERLETIPVDGEGVVRLDALEDMLAAVDGREVLVSVMLANNETGVVQPVADAAGIARRHGALAHCDAAQAAGKLPVSMPALGVHLLALSAHKLGGPAGAGALIVSPEVALAAEMRGGGQERGLRAGSENVVGIAGFAAAAEAADLAAAERLRRLRDGLERRLQAICPSAQAFGTAAMRLPNTSCVVMPGLASETQVIAFDLAGVAVSAGSACSSGKVGRSHVLAAMAVGEDLAGSAIRVSLGWSTTDADVERFIDVWSSVYARAAAGGRSGTEAPIAATAR